MKQILLERQGYSERIEKMFGKGMINKDVGICFLHISRHLHFLYINKAVFTLHKLLLRCLNT